MTRRFWVAPKGGEFRNYVQADNARGAAYYVAMKTLEPKERAEFDVYDPQDTSTPKTSWAVAYHVEGENSWYESYEVQ